MLQKLSPDSQEKKKESKINYFDFSDYDLICRCQEGQRAAFEVLVRRYQRIVFSILYQLAPDWEDLNDLVQEIFIRVYKYIHGLKNPKTFRAWLNQITVNLFYDELRKRPKRVATLSLDSFNLSNKEGNEDESQREIPDLREEPSQLVLNQELASFIRKAMDELPEQFRTAIVLRELQGLSYEEISEAISCELGTVKSRIARARAKLQVALHNYVQRKKEKPSNNQTKARNKISMEKSLEIDSTVKFGFLKK